MWRGYNLKKDNVQLLNLISKFLNARKNYRAALYFIKKNIRNGPKDDLQGITMSLEVYAKLGRADKVESLKTLAQEIIASDPKNKFINSYQRCVTDLKIGKLAEDNDLCGVIEILNSNLIFIKNEEGEKIRVKEKNSISPDIKNSDKILYSTFLEKSLKANFIEPVFENEQQILAIISST